MPTRAVGRAATARVVASWIAFTTLFGCYQRVTAVYTTEQDGEGGAAGGGGAVPIAACRAEIASNFQDADVVGFAADLTFTADVAWFATTPRGRLPRSDGDVPEVVAVRTRIDGPRALRLEADEPLAFFATYELSLDDGLQAEDGSECIGARATVRTRRLAPEPDPLRPGPVTASALVGARLVVASASMRALQTYDLSDPASPMLLSTTPIDCAPVAIEVVDATAYVACGSRGVRIVDVSEPDAPAVVGTIGTPGYAFDVGAFEFADAPHLAIADGSGGLRLVDVSNPEAPVDRATVNPSGATPPSVFALAVSGDRIAVAEGAAGFAIVSVQSPSSPIVVGKRSLQAVSETFGNVVSATDVALDGDRLVVAAGIYGIQSFDASVPASPTFVAHLLPPLGKCEIGCADSQGDLRLVGDQLFSSSAMTGVTRTRLEPSGAFAERRVWGVQGRAESLVVRDDAIVAGGERGLVVFDPVGEGTTSPLYEESFGWGSVTSLWVDGATLYATSMSRGLETYSIALPLRPTPVALAPTPGVERDYGLLDVAGDGQRLVVADGRSGLALFDRSDALAPVAVGTSTGVSFDLATSAVVAGDVAYVCDGNSALRVFDLAATGAPILLGNVPTNDVIGGCLGLALRDDVLYVAGGKGLGVIDVSLRESPVVLGAVALPAGDVIASVAVGETHLFGTTSIADFEGPSGVARRLVVFDLANPTEPALVHRSEVFPALGRLAVRGAKVFASGGGEGVYVFDARAPALPRLEGRVDGLGGDVVDVAFGPTTLYAARRGAGIATVAVGRTE